MPPSPPPRRTGPIRVISADPEPLFRDALARSIRLDRKLELVAEVDDGAQLAAAIERLTPDVAVADAGLIRLPASGSTRLLLLAAEVTSIDAYDAVAQGAAGYLSKDAEPPVIRRAIAAVARGETVLDPSAQTGIAKEIRLRTRDERPELSGREREILVLIADGQTAPQIARRLHLSTATADTSRSTRCSSAPRARASATSSGLATRARPHPRVRSSSPTTRPTRAASAATRWRWRPSTSCARRSSRRGPGRGPRSSRAPSSLGACCSATAHGGTSASPGRQTARTCGSARRRTRRERGLSARTSSAGPSSTRPAPRRARGRCG